MKIPYHILNNPKMLKKACSTSSCNKKKVLKQSFKARMARLLKVSENKLTE